MAKTGTTPPGVNHSLQQIGQNIDLARKRRRLKIDLLCDAARISPQTYRRLVRGEAGVSIGVIGNVLSALNLEQHLNALADPDNDPLGLALERRNQSKRIRSRTGGLNELDTNF